MSRVAWALILAIGLPLVTATTATSRQGMRMHAQMNSKMHARMKSRMELTTMANPIRKVIRVLERMLESSKKLGIKNNKLCDEEGCECVKDIQKQEAVVAYYNGEIEILRPEYNELAAQAETLKGVLLKQREDMANAKKDLDRAKSLHGKEGDQMYKQLSDYRANIQAMEMAIEALRKGTESSFLQTDSAGTIRKFVENADLPDNDRDTLSSFLHIENGDQNQDGNDEGPTVDEVIGLLSQLKETMARDHDELELQYNREYGQYMAMIKAKEREIKELDEAITENSSKLANLMVKVQEKRQEIMSIMSGAYKRESELLRLLKERCDREAKRCKRIKEMHLDEAAALTECINLLGNDHSLDLFKKTLPQGSGESLLQLTANEDQIVKDARSVLHKFRQVKSDYRVDAIALLMHGKKVDMSEVITMIDKLVALLDKEKDDEWEQKEHCKTELGQNKFKQMQLEKTLGPIRTQIQLMETDIENMSDQIDTLTTSLKDLTKSIQDAGWLRQQQHREWKNDSLAANSALSLLKVCRERLDRFYGAYIQLTGLTQQPQNAGTVLSLLDKITHELEMQMAEEKTEEDQAQKDYEDLVESSEKARDTKVKLLKKFRSDKAEADALLQTIKEDNRDLIDEAESLARILAGLHKECDWLVETFDARVAARTAERDALKEAKAVLSGAAPEFFLQEKSMQLPIKSEQSMLRGSKSL